MSLSSASLPQWSALWQPGSQVAGAHAARVCALLGDGNGQSKRHAIGHVAARVTMLWVEGREGARTATKTGRSGQNLDGQGDRAYMFSAP
ncbi:hypothetical protein BD309DRAFT_975997, partial [Dichomitus squalens]